MMKSMINQSTHSEESNDMIHVNFDTTKNLEDCDYVFIGSFTSKGGRDSYYYASSKNGFWNLLTNAFNKDGNDENVPTTPEEMKTFCKSHRIKIIDIFSGIVMKSGKDGSLDTNIDAKHSEWNKDLYLSLIQCEKKRMPKLYVTSCFVRDHLVSLLKYPAKKIPDLPLSDVSETLYEFVFDRLICLPSPSPRAAIFKDKKENETLRDYKIRKWKELIQ